MGWSRWNPEIVYQMPAWSDELYDLLGRQQSVENSTAVFEDKAYFATSAGRVVGVDVSDVENGNAEVFFDFWMGDDIDSTITIDADGLPVRRSARRSREDQQHGGATRSGGRTVGEARHHRSRSAIRSPASRRSSGASRSRPREGQDTGVWATPALHPDGVLYVPTDSGNLLAIDTDTGETVWSDDVGVNAWSSPAIVDGALVIAVDCFSEEPPACARTTCQRSRSRPTELWTRPLATGGCIESTPAVWNGNIYVGSRDGFMYAFGS